MIIEEIKNIKDTITEILLANPHLRDDDYKLILSLIHISEPTRPY